MFDPPHPGEFITETYLVPFGISARALAAALNVAVTSVTRILSGDGGVSPAMALRLQKVLGGSAESWLEMQEIYDLAKARKEVDTSACRSLIHEFA
jgi:addiction module HigA family antidote